ncbi:MAG: hypothetical protein OJF50_005820 [Nitrospira sp.]|nr:hypothetical protein [Nitrospira sp.]
MTTSSCKGWVGECVEHVAIDRFLCQLMRRIVVDLYVTDQLRIAR